MEEALLRRERQDGQWRSQYSFLTVFSLSVFLAGLSHSFLTPWLWDYFETVLSTQAHTDTTTQGVVWAANTVGELCGALGFGLLYNHSSVRVTLLLCMSAGVLAGLLHFLTTLTSEVLVPMEVLIGVRLLQGLWTGGQLTIVQAYVSEVVNDCHKLKVLAELGIASVLGLLLGPAAGMVLSALQLHLSQAWPGGLYLPALVHVGCVLCVLIVTYAYFEEFPLTFRLSEDVPQPSKPGLFLCLLICLVLKSGFAVSEHISKPLLTYSPSVLSTQEIYVHFRWSDEDLYLLLILALTGSLVAYAVLALTEGELEERQLLIAALGVAAGGWILLFDSSGETIPFSLFVLGYMCDLALSYPVGYTTLVCVLSKLIGPNQAVMIRQGVYMGLLVASGALARTAAPYWSFPLLMHSSQLCFGLIALCLGLSALSACAFGSLLAPHPMNSRINVISFDEPSRIDRPTMNPHETGSSRGDSEDDTYLFASLEPSLLRTK